ncbi:MAG TPA: hypothetical protein VLJ68_02290 [Chitinophagaceae bacterium]|nr:hypothetical protein [Chitinophagaceae bacterium]
MRHAILTSLVAVCACVANAQLTILPQIGAELTGNEISYNSRELSMPVGISFAPQVSIRLDYKFKTGFGPYIALGTTRQTISFVFSDLENGMNDFKTSAGNMKLRFEAGYQLTTKKFFFPSSDHSKSHSKYAGRSMSKESCSSSRNLPPCCSSKSSAKERSKTKGTWMKIQPNIGFAFIPGTGSSDILQKGSTYEYKAGNWNTAFTGGAGLEFGRNTKRSFVISFNYVKGFSNMGPRTISVVSAGKTTSATLSSESNSFNIRVGIPIGFERSFFNNRNMHHRMKNAKKCGEYRPFGCGGLRGN